MRSEIRWIQRERGEEEVEERREREKMIRGIGGRRKCQRGRKDDGDKGEKAKWRKKLISPTNSKIVLNY